MQMQAAQTAAARVAGTVAVPTLAARERQTAYGAKTRFDVDRQRAAILVMRFPNFSLAYRKLLSSRPTIELQSEAADCGYVCISAVFALAGEVRRVSAIKETGGTTSRGLTLKQIRDVSRRCGLAAEAIAYSPDRLASLNFPLILLLSRGHYVVAARCVAGALEIYDPGMGWYWLPAQKLRRRLTNYAIEFNFPPARKSRQDSARVQPVSHYPFMLSALLRRPDGRRVVAIVAAGQALALAIPLISMLAVNRSTDNHALSALGAVGILFLALSLTNVLVGLAGELSAVRLKRSTYVDASRLAFDRLSEKSASWFIRHAPDKIKNLIDSYYVQLDLSLEMLRSSAGIALGLILGATILVFASPWLAVPGLLALGLTSTIDVIVNRHQRSHFANSLEAAQRKQHFVLDVLCQMPELIRTGVGARARARFASVVRTASTAEASLNALQGWRTALLALVRSGETLIFVSISALFWSRGDYSLGAFVALGAYKDLMAQNLNALLQLHLRKQSMNVHRLQADPLLESSGASQERLTPVTTGRVEVSDTAYRYGSLDPIVFEGCSLHVSPGEFVAIRGPSGAGKSTFARLLIGAAQPSTGVVLIDGQPSALGRMGVAAVLQTDRLIAADIISNILYFRDQLDLADAIEALKLVELHDFVMSLSMRWKTFVSDTGDGLSGGQRQRLLLARALVDRPKLLVLDEATSSLDVEVERRIFARLRDKGISLIVIAHRPEIWAMADRVYDFSPNGIVSVESPPLMQVRSG